VKVRSLNLDLGLSWKDLGMKIGRFVEEYKALLFSKF
jgi:hypothetical protein